jgi:hypothetical protein
MCDIYFFDLVYDSYVNPNILIKWRISREKYDTTKIKGFNIYKRKNITSRVRNDHLDTQFAFDKISRGVSLGGKFSSEKKAIQYLDKGLSPITALNPNISKIQEEAAARQAALNNAYVASNKRNISTYIPLEQQQTNMQSTYTYGQRGIFEKIAYIDYSKFLESEKKKQVFITDYDYIYLEHSDIFVAFGDVFSYYVTILTEDGREGGQSNIIDIEISDLKPVKKPQYVKVTKSSTNSVKISIITDPKEDVYMAHIYRLGGEGKEEIDYGLLAQVKNINDYMEFEDGPDISSKKTTGFKTIITDDGIEVRPTETTLTTPIKVGMKYTYRIFLENVYGVLSEPVEMTIDMTVQKTTGRSQANILKDSILSVVQDQNSTNVRITINNADPSVFYYAITRRDLTIYEERFTVPNDEKNKSSSWNNGNKLFVTHNKDLGQLIRSSFGNLIDTSSFYDVLTFVDDFVMVGHIYEYRIIGYDIHNNRTSCMFKMIRPTGKKTVPEPINLFFDRIQEFPLIQRIYWNVAGPSNAGYTKRFSYIYDEKKDEYSLKEVAAVANQQLDNKVEKTSFIVERRKAGDKNYWPFAFLDEQISNYIEDSAPIGPNGKLDKNITRPVGMPPYLEDNTFYYYRVAFIDKERGIKSGYSEELKTNTFLRLSEPINFKSEYNDSIFPRYVRLTWDIEENTLEPDHWQIERKLDIDNSVFEVVGNSYLKTEFLDANIEKNKNYIYRIRSYDNLGRRSINEITTKIRTDRSQNVISMIYG